MGKKDIINNYYNQNIKNGRHDYELLGWESREAHLKRFEILVSNVDLKNKRILDAGCGLGSLLNYIKQKRINIKYTGIDILEQMIELALRRNPEEDFRCLDIFKENPFEEKSFDVVYSSGMFNLNMGNNIEFLIKSIKSFSILSNQYVVISMLHAQSRDKEDTYFYYDPLDVKANIGKSISNVKDLKILDGYLHNDFTIIIELN